MYLYLYVNKYVNQDIYEHLCLYAFFSYILLQSYHQTIIDAISVQRLKAAGAIILGKSNLHEFALEGLSVSSLGGQTRNPVRKSPFSSRVFLL
jgi:hypothetical protein